MPLTLITAPKDIHGVTSSALDRLSFRRSVIGFATVLVVSFAYNESPIVTVLIEWWSRLLINSALGLAATLVCVLVLYFATPREFRSQLLTGVRGPLRKLLLLFMTVMIFTFALVAIFPDPEKTSFLLKLMVTPAYIWYLAYMACAAYWIVRTVFWVGDIHPLLVPIGAGIVLVVSTMFELMYQDSDVPFGLRLVMALFGVVTTLILARFEYNYIIARGVRWTTGPDARQRLQR